jgi:hypothetical protein
VISFVDCNINRLQNNKTALDIITEKINDPRYKLEYSKYLVIMKALLTAGASQMNEVSPKRHTQLISNLSNYSALRVIVGEYMMCVMYLYFSWWCNYHRLY